MTFGGGHGLGKVLANNLVGQTWPGGEVAGVDRLGPSGHNWAESTAMEILDQVGLGPHFLASASLDRRKRQRDKSWSSNQIKVVETVFRVSGAADGGAAVGEGDTSFVKGSSETIVTKLPNGVVPAPDIC